MSSTRSAWVRVTFKVSRARVRVKVRAMGQG